MQLLDKQKNPELFFFNIRIDDTFIIHIILD